MKSMPRTPRAFVISSSQHQTVVWIFWHRKPFPDFVGDHCTSCTSQKKAAHPPVKHSASHMALPSSMRLLPSELLQILTFTKVRCRKSPLSHPNFQRLSSDRYNSTALLNCYIYFSWRDPVVADPTCTSTNALLQGHIRSFGLACSKLLVAQKWRIYETWFYHIVYQFLPIIFTNIQYVFFKICRNFVSHTHTYTMYIILVMING